MKKENKPSLARPDFPGDSDKFRTGMNMTFEMMELNPNIDPGLWIGIFFHIISHLIFGNGFSYQQFCKKLDKQKEFYGVLWGKNKKELHEEIK